MLNGWKLHRNIAIALHRNILVVGIDAIVIVEFLALLAVGCNTPEGAVVIL